MKEKLQDDFERKRKGEPWTKPLHYNVTIFSGSESVNAEDLLSILRDRLDGMGVKLPLVEIACPECLEQNRPHHHQEGVK